eukprot:463627-Prymnesium_polylepis.1
MVASSRSPPHCSSFSCVRSRNSSRERGASYSSDGCWSAEQKPSTQKPEGSPPRKFPSLQK